MQDEIKVSKRITKKQREYIEKRIKFHMDKMQLEMQRFVNEVSKWVLDL